MNNIKVIIGNGFDLQCHLKTSYSDYFNYKYNDCGEVLSKWYTKFKDNVDNYLVGIREHLNRDNSWENLNNFDKYNTWDFFFWLYSPNYSGKDIKDICDINWCDIEQAMLDSFDDNNNSKNIKFSEVYKVFNKECYLVDIKDDSKIIAAIISKRYGYNKKEFSNKYDFYKFLLDELKIFEKNFGEYIKKQSEDNNRKKDIKTLVSKLIDNNSLVEVNSFNYSDLYYEKFNSKLIHINGDIELPIFGIDTNDIDPKDDIYIFTKQYRRMEQIKKRNNKRSFNKNINEVIIYGCSLSRADYSYFFSLFDEVKLIDDSSNVNIVFAYSIYDKAKEEEIIKNLNRSISTLFFEYSKYKLNKSSSRLLEMLTFKNKVCIKEIE